MECGWSGENDETSGRLSIGGHGAHFHYEREFGKKGGAERDNENIEWGVLPRASTWGI